MRIMILACVSVLALAACNPSGTSDSAGNTQGADSAANGGPPQNTGVSFRQEATIIGPDGQAIPQVLIHEGGKIRTEMNGPGGSMINIVNSDTREAITIMQMGGRTIATRSMMPEPEAAADVTPEQIEQMRERLRATTRRGGSCSAAGETGTEWTMGAPEGAEAMGERTMCITSDGITLQMKQEGRLVFDTQSIQRGPQDASLFQVPPGVQVTTRELPSRDSINAAIERAKAAAAQHAPAP